MSSTDVVLFGHWICPFSVRVEFALAQKEIAYSLVNVPPRAVRPKGFVVPEEFIAHSPKLEVPMVRVGETYLADSIPILQWLEELFPSHS
jgi:glutathione S-transferase